MKHIIYSKISNQRDNKHSVVTSIYEDQGRKYVEKRAENEESQPFINNLFIIYEKLNVVFSGGGLKPVKSEKKDGSLVMEFVDGVSLDFLLKDAIDQNDEKRFFDLLDRYKREVASVYRTSPFEENPEFDDVFGHHENFVYGEGAENLNIDLIPQNIIIDEGGEWTFIDYEWTFDFQVPFKYLFYRAICYLMKNEESAYAFGKDLYEWIGLSDFEKHEFQALEKYFQDVYLSDKYHSLEEINAKYYYASDDMNFAHKVNSLDAPKVYYNKGNGFNEADSEVLSIRKNNELYEVRIINLSDCMEFRFDPAESATLFELCDVVGIDGDGNESVLEYHSNGIALSDNSYYFDNADPYLIFDINEKYRTVIIRYRINAFFLSNKNISSRIITNAVHERDQKICELLARVDYLENLGIVRFARRINKLLKKIRNK